MCYLPKPVVLKVQRAAEQAQSLKGEIEAWTAANPLEYTHGFLEGNLGYRMVHTGYKSPPPTDRWSILFGELIHNLRSALDNLAWELACAVKVPSEKDAFYLKFPIYTLEAKFDKYTKDILRQMDPNVAGCLKAMQPFKDKPHDPDFHFLARLNTLSNEDKHRVPYVAFNSLHTLHFPRHETFMTAEDMKTNTVDSYWWNGQEPLQANTVLYEVKTKNPITFYDPILRIYPCVSVSISGKQSPVEWLAPFFVEKVAYICDIFNAYFAVVSKQKAENQPPAN